jgi:hypothetical protein
LGGALFAGELFGHGPVGIVALEDAVAVAVKAERHAVSRDHGMHCAHIAERVFRFELKMSGEDLAGGIVLKADEGELGAAAFEPVMTAGVGEHHHAKARTAQAASAVLARAALLRRSQLGRAQNAAHALAADHEFLLAAQFFTEMRIVEAGILAAPVRGWCAAGPRAKPRAWAVRGCRDAPNRRRRDDGAA